MTLSLTLSLRYEYRLMGAENFTPWKESVTLLFEELGIWEITNQAVIIHIDPIILDEY